MRCFFNWALEHCYCKENPFEKIKLLPKQRKKRILIDKETRDRITDYFRREKPQMLLVSMLVYSSAIRPKEIANIQLKHINIDKHYILIEETNAKNHKARCATITKEITEMIMPLMEGTTTLTITFSAPASRWIRHRVRLVTTTSQRTGTR